MRAKFAAQAASLLVGKWMHETERAATFTRGWAPDGLGRQLLWSLMLFAVVRSCIKQFTDDQPHSKVMSSSGQSSQSPQGFIVWSPLKGNM